MSIAFEPETEPRQSGSPLKLLGMLALGLVVGAGGVWLFGLRHAPPVAAAPEPARQLYHCPMHPQVVQDHPGHCPLCGMELVPNRVAEPSTGKGKILFYRSPMDPKVTSPTPKKDDMGMDYVPVYESDVAGQAPPVAG
ncbi:MAG: hypothetical protein KGI56_05955, partial [Acidobacteriota bacterium]|nr:hypothetical protein [Acidobacteriota bacterium]